MLVSLLLGVAESSCPCKDSKLCDPLQTPARSELFVFGGSGYELYNWTNITTLVWWDGPWDPNVICYAHARGVRVVLATGSIHTPELHDPQRIDNYIQQILATVQSQYMDGVNIDFEDRIDEEDHISRDLFTLFVKKLSTAIYSNIPGSQVTIDVGWAPNKDVRFYDYYTLSTLVDFFFVMAYDEQSQIFGICKAGPTSDFRNLDIGISMFVAEGIPVDKLVLGLPWYGHSFSCVNQVNDTVCPIPLFPWRGVICSDLYATEYAYQDIISQYLPISSTGIRWDEDSKSVWLNYVDINGYPRQLWFDNATSLSMKVEWAKFAKMRGVGMYTADFVDYTKQQYLDFWVAFNNFFD
uniref:GH18 domain-containing protein n=1 Tax=Arcella intermedia TaxID=1963864 RepID=A0A6B2L8F3_9EUKA